ncbi:GTPase activating rab protein [Rhodotorula diobovata]|uniref:GTPase activating rab protein n=1 Tax=Rhodotorula diobovata TaxID=5288 RepID=A0A5C5FV83_9BASI|nr:GTPase activating rab protein [Rhodotorula diobovata]
MAQPRTPLPTSHAHPLSPPLDPPTTSFLPDLRSDLLDSRSDTNSPLFPASPPDNSPTAELRRGSVATLLARTSSSQGVDGGIGLGLPAIATSRSDSRDRPPTINSSGTRSRATSSPSPPPSTPLPQHLSFPSPPHTLQPAALTSLPLSHLVALAQALSAQLEEAQATLREGRAELQALETLAADKGAGEGELERAKVRARTELREKEGRGGSLSKARERAKGKGKGKEEWRIELPVQDGDVAPEVPAKVEVDLDLEDLTEAISSNAFDLGLASPRPSSEPTDAASIRSHAVSLPIPSSATPDDQFDRSSVSSLPLAASAAPPSSSVPTHTPIPSTSKPVRPRHASLSARFVGYIAGAPSASSSSSVAPPPLPASTSSAPSAPAAVDSPSPKKRTVRSDSIRSVSSTASGRAGYGEWLGWKGWGRSGTGSIKEGKTGEVEAEGEEPEDGGQGQAAAENSVEDAQKIVVEGRGDATNVRTGRQRGSSDASSVNVPPHEAPTSPSSSRRTSLTRSTLASTLPTSQPSSPPSSNRALDPITPTATGTVSPERRRSTASSPSLHPPDSPTLTRTRSPGPPPTIFSTTAQGTASAVLSTPLTTSTISAPSMASPSRLSGKSLPTSPARSPSSKSISLPDEPSESRPEAREAGDEGEATIKARVAGKSGEARPSFVPGVPLYSAPPDATGKAVSSSDAGYVAAARGTLSRALGLGASMAAGASTSASSATSSPAAASPSPEPNLTVFPRLPSLSISRYSPFAQPALSTPATHVSLSASTSSVATVNTTVGSSHQPSPLVPHTATLTSVPKSRGGAQTMELDTISGEAAPPSLALLKPSYQSGSAARDGSGAGVDDDGDGPMIDRYGFVYDLRAGMELLKESRRRKEGQSGRGGSKARKKPSVKDVPAAGGLQQPERVDALLTPPTELEVQPQLDALREAIGLTPTTEEENTLSTPATPDRGPSPSGTPHSRPAKLVRDASLSTTASSDSRAPSEISGAALAGPQSMRALLAQLRSMTDAVDKVQQDAWDAFIRRRQAKLAKLKAQHLSDVSNDELSAGGASAGGLGARERPKSLWLAAVTADEMGGGGPGGEEGWTSENLVGVAQMGTEKKGKKEDWNDFKDLVRKGIPITYRPKIWGECSSANEAREPGVYQELLAQPLMPGEAQCLKQIDMDCHRTFPTNVFFAGNGPGVAKLRNVLVAYSRRNPKIGYCQGMNNLVATLLLTHPAEEDAFWVLVCIIENILPSDYYTSHLLVSRADQQVLQDLVARILPRLAAHLEEQGVELTAITFSWFLSLFTDSLPIQTLLRVWDLFFIHGTIFLFRVALAILKLHEPDLLECDSAASLYALLGQLPAGLWNADRLLKVACEDLATAIKDREVSGLRNKHVAALQEEMGLNATGEEEAQV